MPGEGPFSVRKCPQCGADNPGFTRECACGQRLTTAATSAMRGETEAPGQTRRRPWLAAALGFVWPGVGYLYAGRVLYGALVVLLIPPVELAIFLLAVVVPVPVANIVIAASLWLALHALFAHGAYNAARAASAFSQGTPVPFFSRWYGWVTAVVLAAGPNVLWTHGYRVTFLDAYKVPTGSMEATILRGDRLLAINWAYGWRIPLVQGFIFFSRQASRGDIVVFRSPLDRTRPWIMRVIGLPNETIEIRDRKVLVNGKPLDEPYARFLVSDDHRGGSLESFLEAQSSSDPRLASRLRELRAGSLSDPSLTSMLRSPDNWGPAPVPPDSYFVLGDNRDNSRDSRFWGFVPEDDLLGRATVMYWSSDPRGGRIRWERIGRRLK